MIGHGVSSRSSHSAAAGRTTSAAKPWTQSRMSFWSWLSSSEKVAAEASPAAVRLVDEALGRVRLSRSLLEYDICLCNIVKGKG